MPMGLPGRLIRGLTLLCVAAYGAKAAQTSDLLAELTKLPQCGLNCFTSVISETSCSITDATCICTDKKFHSLAQDCVLSNCTVEQGLEISRIEANACGRPVRSKKHNLFIPLIVEATAWLCPWIRLYSRWSTQGRWAVDDQIMFLTGLFYTVFLVLGHYTGQLAFGVDIWTLQPEVITTALKLFYIDESFYVVPLGLAKLSVLSFYLRIFPNANFRLALYATMALVLIPTITFLFLQIFQCYPVHYVWDSWRHPEIQAGHCLDLHLVTFTAAAFSILQDVVIIILPLPLLYGLHMEKRTKWGIIIMFSLGVFVTITSIIRLRYIVVFGRTVNPTWDYADVLIWTGLELAVAIIVACLPAIYVLLKSVVGIVSSLASGYAKNTDASASQNNVKGNQVNKKHESIPPQEIPLFPWERRREDSESQSELGLSRTGAPSMAAGSIQTHISAPGETRGRDSDDDFMSSFEGIIINTVTTVRTSVSRRP